VHSKRYYFASAQPDSVRHDIDDRPLQPLSDEDRMTAQNRFLALKQKGADGDGKSASTPSSPPPSQQAMTKSEQIRAGVLGRGKSQRSSSTEAG
jgi:hypothetical protein